MATYKIQSGDTLSALAAKNNTTVADLQKLNNIADPNKIFAGAELKLPDAPAASPAPSATPTPAAADANNPITSSDLNKGTSLPDPTSLLATNAPAGSLNDSITKIASTTLTGTQKAIDDLQARKEAQLTADKTTAAADVKTATDQLNTIKNSTQLQDTLKTINDKFQVDKTITALQDVNTRIVQAQDALNVGLAYEQSRPARLQVISGRTATLKNQGLATIGALQGVASVLQGNLNLAKAYSEQALSAIQDDNNRSMTALTTLLNLANNKLVDLTDEERKTVDSRITALSDQSKKLEADKSDIQDLMIKYPDEFMKGGVTLLDTKDQALQKIMPRLAITERLKLAKELAGANAGKITPQQTQQLKDELLTNKGKGLTYDQAIQHYGAVLDVSYINSVYPEEAKRAALIEDPLKTLTNDYYSKFLDANGNVVSGTTISVDPKNGRLNVTQSKDNGPGLWDKVKTIFSNVF